jgi:heptosyltransferase III
LADVPESTSQTLKILIVRPDRLGDVVLSTPVFEVVKRHYPRSHLTVMVQASLKPLIAGLPYVDEVLVFDPDGKHHGIRGFFRLFREIRKQKFRIAVVLQTRFRVALAVFLSNIRYRVGPLSKTHSFIFYNRGVRQHRSQVEMHETDYNLQLLRRLGIRVGTRNVLTRISVPDDSKKVARQWLEERGWKGDVPLVIVHPGMGGSALNWPESHYLELIRALIREGRQVLVTAGPTEGSLIDRIREGLGAIHEKALFYGGATVGPIDHLAGLISWSSLVVAPSTGPLHIAVALDKPVVTFYPPIRVQSALRWGPYLREDGKATIFVPEVYCGEDFKCRGTLCNYFPCMKSLSVIQALEQVNFQLSRPREIPQER